ncbi:tyrosine-type recombinase/integrase [Aeromicrobium sp.]|uniref:tyrosine-type recombinase/integrase n=1 Tax=Aeromicrobium sp. TaxID=1871063 RepID=UPI0025B8C5B0|nr:tyrosine-type recombinase/integrase [Aeromicrobium sp.]
MAQPRAEQWLTRQRNTGSHRAQYPPRRRKRRFRSRRAWLLHCRRTCRGGQPRKLCSPTSGATSSARGRCSGPCAPHAPLAGLPSGFRFHDLRHYLASMLIASGAHVKVVQARLRHASAKTTLDTYAHLWPDSDESTRAAIGAVMAARVASLRDVEADSR